MSFRKTVWYKMLWSFAWLLLAGAAVLLVADGSRWYISIGIAVVALSMLAVHLIWEYCEAIATRLSKALGGRSLRDLQVVTKTFAYYEFVDVFRATERLCFEHQAKVIESQHRASLNSIINENIDDPGPCKPEMRPYVVGFAHEDYFPIDRFWALTGESLAVVRLRIDLETGGAVLEIAASDNDWGEQFARQIEQESFQNSIYRNHLVQITTEREEQDWFPHYYGVFLRFKVETPISSDDIVLEGNVEKLLQRNIFSFHEMRDRLRAHGIPSKKGMLFYGPPGTGKTYTCKYVFNRLAGVTTLVATGRTLHQVKAICQIARNLQPSLLILEDVDLVFSSREINPDSGTLGDLLDELDGFQTDDDVIFIVTTNAIDRLEAAIKDRPGRINQCVLFDLPSDELRERYLTRYLRAYDASRVDIAHLVKATDGASHAFIKELIFRAVQISLEDSNGLTDVHLHEAHFDEALDEMKQFDGESTRSIMGFAADNYP